MKNNQELQSEFITKIKEIEKQKTIKIKQDLVEYYRKRVSAQ